MIIFKKLTIRNFLSFGNNTQVIDLTKNFMTLIQGLNIDKGDEEDNKSGAGKTSILQAVHYALFGKSINNKITKKNLINKINKKYLEVSIEFSKNEIEYRIERGRSPDYLKFFINDKENLDETNEAQGENSKTQFEINKILGFDEDIFCQTIMMTSSVESFFNKSLADQRTTIEQLLGISILSEKADKLKTTLKETKQIINNEETRLSTIDIANKQILDTHQKQKETLENLLKQFNENKEKNILNYKTELDNLLRINIEDEETKIKNNLSIDEIIKNNDIKNKQIESLNNEIQKLNNDLSSLIIENKIDLNEELNKHNQNKIIIEENNKINENKLLVVNKIKELENNLNNINLEENSNIKNIELGYNDKISNYKLALTAETKLKELDNNILILKENVKKSEEGVCPVCNQKLCSDNILNNYKKELSDKEHLKETIIGKINEVKLLLESEEKNKLQEIQDIKSKNNDKRNNLKNDIEKYNKELESFKETSLIQTYFKTIEELYSYKNTIEQNMIKRDNILKDIDKLKDSIKEIVIEKVPEKEVTIYNSLEEIITHKNKIIEIENNIKKEESTINPYIEQLSKLDSELKLLDRDDSLINLKKDDEKHLDFLIKLLVNKDSFVRKKIIEQNLNYLNQRLKKYLKDINILHTITFNSDMTIDITKQGESFDFANLSQGEKTAVIISLNMSFRDLYELINSETNLLMIDELIDLGLDSIMAQNVLKIISSQKSNKNIFIISHRPDIQAYFDNTLIVTMERGFTNI